MVTYDDELKAFEVHGAAPLPVPHDEAYVEHDGARIWYASYGVGAPVLLLHGGLGNSENWGYQLPALLERGYRPIVIDSRGHGRSTRDERPFVYELMASDVLAVMDTLRLPKAALAGWSDGAVIALIVAMREPSRVSGVFFFGCNMDPSGTKPFRPSPVIDRIFRRHARDYVRLSATPDDFETFAGAVGRMMEAQPNYSVEDMRAISVPVTIAYAVHDEFIEREHAEYLARSIPNARFDLLEEVSHFAPLQRPNEFNAKLLASLASFSER